jgi:hypothetical protein
MAMAGASGPATTAAAADVRRNVRRVTGAMERPSSLDMVAERE